MLGNGVVAVQPCPTDSARPPGLLVVYEEDALSALSIRSE